ncbi:type IV pilus secretin PilQ [Oceanimonas baumannii]|uniref:Type IV pilus assembly protein PilQ n=2 Tax=Oceanimonas baumannii TaxID=129578 RepID=A0ABY2F1U6_9GAMM|nr:type IV pilus secretin PilQ [Oceanimonas baumannii]TDW61402.1 type IV pilus assembly protein PilQ [Oceanimonas baumannii]
MENTNARRPATWITAMLLWLISQPALAITLEAVRVSPMTSHQLMLEMVFDLPPVVIERRMEEPAGLILRLPGASSVLEDHHIPIERQGIPAVDIRRFNDALEVIVPMPHQLPRRVQKEGKVLRVLLGSAVNAAAATEPPPVRAPVTARVTEHRRHHGSKPISMNFQDIPVRTALQLIADFNGFNLVTTDSVQGSLTLRLEQVPWDQALDTILQVRGLDKRINGNILLVAPAAELALQEQKKLESRQAREVLAPLETEFLQVNYARAADVVALLTNENTRLLSERGAIAVDDRTNMLVIRETRENIDNVHRMLALLDIPIKQVVIEARMVTINEGLEEELGINWEYRNDTRGQHNQTDGNFNVNLPLASEGGSIGLQIAKLSGDAILDLELAALERENRAEIIASPRVTTSSQKPAVIQQGVQIPYSTVSDSGTNVEFAEAFLSLNVTPQITPDQRVVLDLVVTQDSVGEFIPQADGSQVPSINAQSVTTQVLVNDGETLVLGGIYQQDMLRRVSKVPVLGDIPVVGHLFKSTSDTNRKRELIIFVTPRIVHDNI